MTKMEERRERDIRDETRQCSGGLAVQLGINLHRLIDMDETRAIMEEVKGCRVDERAVQWRAGDTSFRSISSRLEDGTSFAADKEIV